MKSLVLSLLTMGTMISVANASITKEIKNGKR